MNGFNKRTPRTARRRGVSLMVAVVLLALTTSLLLAAARTAALHRRSLGPNQAAVQADLLADAAARLNASGEASALPWRPELPGGTATVSLESSTAGDGLTAGDGSSAAPPSLIAAVELDGATARTRRAFRRVEPSKTSPANRAPRLAPKPERPADDDDASRLE
ncbi:hypothetical protein [Alienimonas chondri]|uniref:Uncharacterized protein n=1 Tax=Alienimonas chondri TaxID=2681879 RepID=A0ABX1VBH5_9PLAN|nr:hypothetical protein [Alienimonas chondri]NNJ25465.1 hypothetical protein [Alienimonas chondri]